MSWLGGGSSANRDSERDQGNSQCCDREDQGEARSERNDLMRRRPRVRIEDWLCPQKAQDFCPKCWDGQSGMVQRLRTKSLLLPGNAEEQVLGADVAMAEFSRLAHAQFENLLGAGCIRGGVRGSLARGSWRGVAPEDRAE